MRQLAFRILWCAWPLLLAGCMSREPYHRTDVWKPIGANAANIAAMAADPHDLIRGRGVSQYPAKEPEAAVEQTWTIPKSGGGGGGGGSAGAGGSGGAASTGSGG